MSKLADLLKTTAFWPRFIVGFAAMLALQTFFLGLWALPVIGYRVGYMGENGSDDISFVIAFSVLFGFAVALFLIGKRCGAGVCVTGISGGATTLFTMLCPVCPVFFLSLLGLSTGVSAIAPYFWPLRLLALGLVCSSILLLWRRFSPDLLPKLGFNIHDILQGSSLAAVFVLLIGNQAIAQQLAEQLLDGPQTGGEVALSGDFSRDVAALVTMTAVPFYGQELGLDLSSVENINASVRALASMEPGRGSAAIELTPAEKKRYIAIGTQPTVTCEFCCGAKTMVRDDGSPTCGCAHMRGMLGTVAYLLKNHPDMSNDEISYEIARQKGLYFPTKLQQRMAEQLSGDATNFSPDIRLLTMNLSAVELAGIQARAKESGFTPPLESPGMVGGC